jgi:DNA-binding transcriptional LysR family regulator
MSRAEDPFDTYLLRVLCTVLTERSVSRAAIRLNQSQPAISLALKRLRGIFNDPLLTRDKAGMVPTERGAQLLETARQALSQVDSLLSEPARFEPANAQQTFRIASPDYIGGFFLVGVLKALHTQAPHARVVLQPLGPDFDYERALADGTLDVVIGNWPEPPAHLHLSMLIEDRIVCLMSDQHPLAHAPLTADAYLSAAHVVPVPYAVAQRGVVESHLASLRVKREAAVAVPYFAMAPYLLPGTDLIFTTSRHFAEHYAALLPLVVAEAPFDFQPMRFYQLWHERSHQSPAHRWLRGVLAEAGRLLASGTQAAASPPRGGAAAQ